MWMYVFRACRVCVISDIYDFQDNYRIIAFEGSELLIKNGIKLKSHLTFDDGPNQLSDRFLRLHFSRCLRVSVCRGDVSEDFDQREIEDFMEELGVDDGDLEMDSTDPRWSTPLGIQVHSYLLREKEDELREKEDELRRLRECVIAP
jgi:hypothetical protein